MKEFSCSYRNSDGKEHVFSIYAIDHDDAECRMLRIRGNANVDGEIISQGPSFSFIQRFFSCLWK